MNALNSVLMLEPMNKVLPVTPSYNGSQVGRTQNPTKPIGFVASMLTQG